MLSECVHAPMSTSPEAGRGKAPSAKATKRGWVSERGWIDVNRAARCVKEHDVVIRVHGMTILPKALKQPNDKDVTKHKVHKAGADAVRAPKAPPVARGASPPRPPNGRQKQRAQRLLDFQEKKRKAAIAEKVAAGVDEAVAAAAVAREEQKRLDARSAARAAQAGADAVLPAQPSPEASSGATRMEV